MAESTLTLALSDLRNAIVEVMLGGNADYSTIQSVEQTRVNNILKSGLRQFYQPPPVNGRVHEWTFLRPTTTLSLQAAYSTGTITVAAGVVTLAGGTFPSWSASGVLRVDGTDYTVNTRDSGTQVTLDDTSLTDASVSAWEIHQDDYDLPDGFAHLMGAPTYAHADGVYHVMQIVGEARIRDLRQRESAATTDPYLIAVRNKVKTTSVGLRMEAMFWPRVQESATLTYRYRVRPDALGDSDTYPHGASDHSETILASCLAAYEKSVEESRGVYWDDFLRRLEASVALDGRTSQPEVLGYNGDDSDNEFGWGDPWRLRDHRRAVGMNMVTHTSN